jgi:hypothetical protein
LQTQLLLLLRHGCCVLLLLLACDMAAATCASRRLQRWLVGEIGNDLYESTSS